MAGAIIACAAQSAPWSGREPEWLADLVAPLLADADPAATGVYLATPDAGAAISTGFWARALRETVTFVSPQDFPLTLASSIATGIARALKLQGPNHTLVGGGDASRAAWDEAAHDLARGIVERAVLIKFVAGHPGLPSSARIVILSAGGDAAEAMSGEDGDPIDKACRVHGVPAARTGKHAHT